MQNLSPLPLLLLLGIFLSGPEALAQVLRENEKGEKIIVYPDGSWQYYLDFGNPDKIFRPDGSSDTTQGGFPTLEADVRPLNEPIMVTEEELRKIAVRRSQITRDAVTIASLRAEEAERHLQMLQKEFEKLKNQVSDARILDQEEKKIKSAQTLLEETQKEVTLAMVEAEKAEGLIKKGTYVEAFTRQRSPGDPSSTYEYASLDNSLAKMITPEERSFVIDPKFKTDPSMPAKPCQVAYEGTDELNGKWRKDLQKQTLFTYTDERLRLYLRDKEYLKCEAFLTALEGGYTFLSLEFSFAYPNAREAYGFIEKGSNLTIKLLNGEYINFRSGEMDQGSYDTETEVLTYKVHYPIDRSQLIFLKKYELDSIIVDWSSGYEEYPVYNLDFFISQMDCLF